MRIDKSYLNFVLALLCLAAISGCGQSKTDALAGKWVSVRAETEDGKTGEDFTLDGEPYHIGDTLIFHNGKAFEPSVDITSSYRLSGDNLRIGDRRFIVEKITETELVLFEDDIPWFPLRTYYVRIAD